MRVDRSRVHLGKMSKNDDPFVNLSPAKRVSLVWELTAELWSLSGVNVKQRLQRNITKLIRQ